MLDSQELQDLINTKWVYNAPLCSLLYVPKILYAYRGCIPKPFGAGQILALPLTPGLFIAAYPYRISVLQEWSDRQYLLALTFACMHLWYNMTSLHIMIFYDVLIFYFSTGQCYFGVLYASDPAHHRPITTLSAFDSLLQVRCGSKWHADFGPALSSLQHQL